MRNVRLSGGNERDDSWDQTDPGSGHWSPHLRARATGARYSPASSKIRRYPPERVARGLAPPRRLLATTSVTMTILTVARADAVAAVSREVARLACEGEAGALALLPAAVWLAMRPYGLLSLRGRPLSPAARAICDALRG